MMTWQERQARARLRALLDERDRSRGRRRPADRRVLIILLCALSIIALALLGLSLEDEPAGAADGYRLRLELARAAALETQRAELLAAHPVGEAVDEAELIEAELVAQGYFRDDIPLSYEEQDLLQSACEASGVPYALALAVIRQETGFRNILGDDGQSAGYMQVQARWHAARMDRLGVTDLMDPGGNFRVGCDFLGELLGRYSLEDSLTYYNSGRTGPSAYAAAVMAGMEEYEQWLS